MRPALLALLALAACGSPATLSGPGASCQTTDTCEPGLDCLDPADTFVSENDMGCVGATAHGITVCTKSCTIDEDCQVFGADVVCAPNGCGPIGICLRRGDGGVGTRPGKP